MTIGLGYLLPTREGVMQGRPQAAPLLDLARRAQGLGFQSLWAGDSLLARPRHDPLTLLAAVAAVAPGMQVGTAILLPVLRNPVLLAQQLATLDQISSGRLILGVGIGADNPAIRAEFVAAGVPFERRLGRTLEALRLCRALWQGEPVNWEGRWNLEGQVLGPRPFRSGGPPIWMGTSVPAGFERTGRWFDGFFPLGPDAATFASRWRAVQASAETAGRSDAVTAAIYLTVSTHDDPMEAERRLDAYLADYYAPLPVAIMRQVQACFAGPEGALEPWLAAFVTAGARHLVLRFVGDHERHLEVVADLRQRASWD